MALRALSTPAFPQLLPRLFLPTLTSLSSSPAAPWTQYSQRFSVLFDTILRPVTLSLSLPALLSDIWESVLRAAPKKKTSHMKKRHRQMAGKALKDVKSLTTCPGCGQIKRAHVLCPDCVKDIKEQWKQAYKE
ncbi:ribosomal protein L32 [Thermoascus aurantiacus ATCC 26904]